MDTSVSAPPPEPAAPASSDPGQRAYYSITQAAALLGISRVTIWRWIGEGRLPAARLGHRTVRISREDLVRTLTQASPTAAGSAASHAPAPTLAGAGGAERAPLPNRAAWSEAHVDAGGHIVQFYDSDQFLLGAVAEFLGTALRGGDAAILIATEAHRTGIERRLRAHGISLAAARAEGRYAWLDAVETLQQIMPGEQPEPARFAELVGNAIARAVAGGRSVRIFGEMVGLLVAQGNHAAAIRLEELWNEFQQTHPFSLMCGYSMPDFGGQSHAELLDEVCATHTHVIPAEGYTTLAHPDERLRAIAMLQQKATWLESEIEERNRAEERLQAALAAERAVRAEAETARRQAQEQIEVQVELNAALREVVEERDQLLTREQVARTEAEALYRVGRHLLSAQLDLEQLVQAVTDAATALSGAQFGAFFYKVVDEGGERYLLYTLSGAARTAFADFPLPRNTSLFGTTFRGERVVRLDDVRRDPRYGRNAPYRGLPPGHLPVVSYLAVPVVSRTGEVLGGLFFGHPEPGVFTERSERVVVGLAAQAALAIDNARLYRQAQQAVQQRDDFLAAVAHDLKGPLTALKGYADVLKRQVKRRTEQGRSLGEADLGHMVEGLDQIGHSAVRMARMINGLLDLARLQLGQPLELERRPVDLVVLAEAAVAVYRQTRRSGPPVRVQTSEAQLVGEWDMARLERVLDNLLSNAVKYSPDGGPVTVTVRREDGEPADPAAGGTGGAPTWAVLAVEDHGLGIRAADLPHIFERFWRAGNVGSRVGGAGIGLAVAREIVEQHGGTISVESREGIGSTFTVRLPLPASAAPAPVAHG
jgi:excisionase family DNA binding protein